MDLVVNRRTFILGHYNNYEYYYYYYYSYYSTLLVIGQVLSFTERRARTQSDEPEHTYQPR